MSTLDTLSRNESVDARNALIDGGKLRLRQGSTTICDVTLGTPAFEAAGTQTAGSARLLGGDGTNPASAGNPLIGYAVADALTGIDNYQYLDSGNVVRRSGAAGPGQELTLAAYVVGTGTAVHITSGTHSQPAS